MNVAVLGAGNWGTTAALLLHGNGHGVRLWEYDAILAREIIRMHENSKFLPGHAIPDDIAVTSDVGEAVNGADIVVFVVPSVHMRATARRACESLAIGGNAVLVSLSKGLEHETFGTMTEVIADEVPGYRIVAMSGPCIASEVARGLPTTIVSASEDPAAAEMVQDVFMSSRFRVYTSDDPRGVQFGGAVKNIIAIAAGMNDGLGFGSNAKSALVTRGIVELTRFGEALGARPETFTGLSGIGDLITTCFSAYSRNRHVGEEIGKGRRLDDVLKDMVMVAEGVPTTRTVCEYSIAHGIDMPITEKVYDVLFNNLPADAAVQDLMMREKKAE